MSGFGVQRIVCKAVAAGIGRKRPVAHKLRGPCADEN